MTRTLARNLYHMLRGAAQKTTVDGLKKRGHRTVSVLNFRDVQQMIGRAIENTLQRRGLSLDRADIQDEVRHEFLSLMTERDALQNTVDSLLREKGELAENHQALASELNKATEEYETAQGSATGAVPEHVARLMQRITAEVSGTQNAAGVNAQLTSKTLSLVQAALEDHAHMLDRETRDGQATNLQQLQRRIEKLKRKLQETENMLKRARTSGMDSDGIVGEPLVPGVKQGDPDFQMKKELLGEIFKLNVELRQMLNKN